MSKARIFLLFKSQLFFSDGIALVLLLLDSELSLATQAAAGYLHEWTFDLYSSFCSILMNIDQPPSQMIMKNS